MRYRDAVPVFTYTGGTMPHLYTYTNSETGVEYTFFNSSSDEQMLDAIEANVSDGSLVACYVREDDQEIRDAGAERLLIATKGNKLRHNSVAVAVRDGRSFLVVNCKRVFSKSLVQAFQLPVRTTQLHKLTRQTRELFLHVVDIMETYDHIQCDEEDYE
jgi:hypothetical protein